MLLLLFHVVHDGLHVLVAAAGKVNHHQVILGQLRRALEHFRQGVSGFQSGDDALLTAADVEGFQGFGVVTEVYSTRPTSCNQACSGPMPG